MRLRGAVVVSVIISLALVQSESNAEQKPCDLFEGRWERERESSLYNYTSCPFIQKEFNCRKNGRSDDLYLRYNWQPHSCSLSRFDGEKFLKMHKGKSIMFVGDSLSRNQWESLNCMLYAAVPETNYVHNSTDEVTTITFTNPFFAGSTINRWVSNMDTEHLRNQQ